MSNDHVSLAESLNGKLHRLFITLILACVILSSFRPIMDHVDLGWHVAQGRWIVHHLAFYHQDAFNYPNLGHTVIDEYPLFQIILYLAWCLGWWAPCLLTALVYATLTWLLLRASRTFDLASSSLPPLAVGLMLLFFQVAFPLRPHMVTYLATAILGIFLLRHRETTNWKFFWPMALLQIAWVNCHSGFVLGPIMIGLFGLEMTIRQAIKTRALPWLTAQTWLAAFLLILLACFVNPYGLARFYLPFYQDSLESIRAYVGEMEPLNGGLASICNDLTFISILVIALGFYFRRGAISYSFLLLALLFYIEALSVKKSWPVFGSFIPLLALSSGAFSSASLIAKKAGWLSVLGHFSITVLAGIFLFLQINPSWPRSLQAQWREYDHSRSEISIDATAWMKAHQIQGRLFHRCEDGGWLQQEGFDHGETFGDTGFGKYDEAFIHENGLVEERPALIPRYLQAYHPDFVVCSTFCYQWPSYLRQQGWRPIFYTPNSSVWTRPDIRPDLPTVIDTDVTSSFDHDLTANGMPADIRLYGRNIIALNSLGLEDFAIAKLTSLLPEIHHAAWYWEAVRFLCFDQPAISLDHRNAFFAEAQQLHDDAVTAEFRAYCLNASGDVDGALHLLEAIPQNQLGNYAAELLLKIYLDRKRPEALALAQHNSSFDLRNGRHWQYLAEAEDQSGHTDAAAIAWEKAIFYYPDDATLIQNATAFAEKTNNAALLKSIDQSAKVYIQQ